MNLPHTYLIRIQEIAVRHLEFTQNLDKRWPLGSRSLTKALKGNSLAILEGWSTVREGLAAYNQAKEVVK